MQLNWHQGSALTQKQLHSYEPKLKTIIENIQSSKSSGYQTPYASINLLHDENYFEQILDLINHKKALNPHAIVLVGIGGSSLGARAIWQACQPYIDFQTPLFICAETTDPDLTAQQLALVDGLLNQKKHVLIIVASKSGTTTETIAQFLLFEQILIRHHPSSYHKYIVAITDKNSALWNYAVKEHYCLLEVPALVGGRFSVMSAIGLFPLGILGIDIATLRNSARNMLDSCLDAKLENNPAAITAAFLHLHYQQGIAISDLFIFSTYLIDLGNWYRQLIAESLGKQKNGSGAPIRVGITPTVSLGSTDLHSMAQLYLAGPIARTTLFVTLDNYRYTVTVPKSIRTESLDTQVQGKSLNQIMQAIAQGTQQAYKEQQLPFLDIHLATTDGAAVGQYMQYAMITVIYLAHLLEINPFDQPQVELYKQQTRKILASE